MRERKFKILLAVFTGLMLGCSFPPVPTGVLAAFAFVPFFLLLSSLETYGQAFRYGYLTFFIFNLITLYWPGGYVHGRDYYMMVAGGLLLFAHPFFFLLPVFAFIFVRKQYSFKTALFIFPFFWVTFEYLHSLTQAAFPWLILGNTQTYDLVLIQIASQTGVYGISFWLLVLNVLTFILFSKLLLREFPVVSKQTFGFIVILAVVYLLPKIYGFAVLVDADGVTNEDTVSVKVAMIQPNIDPFEKWTESAERQLQIHQEMTEEAKQSNVDLVIWSETAIPFYINQPQHQHYFQLIKRQVDTSQFTLFSGFPDIVYYFDEKLLPKTYQVSKAGYKYNSYNSSLLIQPFSDVIQKYAKIRLVPFAERVPWADVFSFLDAMRWNFGLGGWAIGTDTTVFRFRTRQGREVLFSNLICYESIYPGFTAEFVRKGAQFLTIITNDSWWGNTSGAYQHMRYSILRAIENRRWIARCANGGISCFIDPYGRVIGATELYTKKIVVGEIVPQSEMTFYSKLGDWFAEMCLIISLFTLMASIGKVTYYKIREKQNEEVH